MYDMAVHCRTQVQVSAVLGAWSMERMGSHGAHCDNRRCIAEY